MESKTAIENFHSPVRGGALFAERPTCSIAEACQAVGFGRTKLYELMDEGHIQTVRIGRHRLVRVPSPFELSLRELSTPGLERTTFSTVRYGAAAWSVRSSQSADYRPFCGTWCGTRSNRAGREAKIFQAVRTQGSSPLPAPGLFNEINYL
jgi:excisionase family DNA binding protein